MIVTKPFDLQEESLFIKACVSGDLDTVKTLSTETPSLITTPASNGGFPLMFSAQNGHCSINAYLMNNGANPNDTPVSGPNQGRTALWFAAKNKQWAVVQALLAAGANPNGAPVSGPNQGVTALLYAAFNKQWPVVQALLAAGANPNGAPVSGPHQGVTALLYATSDKQCAVVQALLAAGANPNDAPVSGPNQGVTALLVAAKNKQWAVVQALLAAGANPNDAPVSGPHQGRTALCFAMNFDAPFSTIQQLLFYGTSIDSTPSPLTRLLADIKTYTESQSLLKAANDLFSLAEKPYQYTPDYQKNVQTLIKLLKSGLNARKKGRTAVHTAIETGNLPLARHLARFDADLNGVPICDDPVISFFSTIQLLEKRLTALELFLKRAEKQHLNKTTEEKETVLKQYCTEAQEIKVLIKTAAHLLTEKLEKFPNSKKKANIKLLTTRNQFKNLQSIALHIVLASGPSSSSTSDASARSASASSLSLDENEVKQLKISLALEANLEPALLHQLLSENILNKPLSSVFSQTANAQQDREEVLSEIVLEAGQRIASQEQEIKRLSEENAHLKSQVASSSSSVSAFVAAPSSTASISSSASSSSSILSELSASAPTAFSAACTTLLGASREALAQHPQQEKPMEAICPQQPNTKCPDTALADNKTLKRKRVPQS